MSKYFIGLSTSGHDPAFAIVDSNGEVLFAEASERFMQTKRAWGVAPDHIDHISTQLEQLLLSDPQASFYISTSWTKSKQNICGDKIDEVIEPFSALVPANIGSWMMGIQAQIHQNSGHNIRSVFSHNIEDELMHFDHHLCHAVNAIYSAPFANALVLIVDGEGENGSVSLYQMENRKLKRLWRAWGPGSLGTFYCWLTTLCGFDWVAGEEWKVMGLAALGTPDLKLAAQLEKLLIIENGRPIFAEQKIFSEVVKLLQGYQRLPNEPIENAANLAATGQFVYQKFMDQIIASLAKYNEENLVFTGGCALNSSYNGLLQANCDFKQVHVPSAPADDGNAIGAALLGWSKVLGKAEMPFSEGACYLGSIPDPQAIEATVKNSAWTSRSFKNDSAKIVAEELASGKIIGVFRDKAEFGPRALGHRSIFADPRPAHMKDIINNKVKGRESYRPFAPMILEDHQSEWFECTRPSPFMAFALKFKPEKSYLVPAVVHADNTGRLQSVNKTTDPWLYALLQEFYMLTGVPILLNTSFNVMGKPIVHSVEDAVSVFGTTGLDGLLLQDTYFEKNSFNFTLNDKWQR